MAVYKRKASLLEPQSTGGEDCICGINFQNGVTVAKIPSLLAKSGFGSIIREAMGDVEIKVYVPAYGEAIVLIEAKNHQVAPTEFKAEISRFIKIDRGSPGTYREFILACTGVSSSVQPIVRELERLRGAGEFYDTSSGVVRNSLLEFCGRVRGEGYTDDVAHFLLDKVRVEYGYALAKSNPLALFGQALTENLPEFENVPGKFIEPAYNNLMGLLQSKLAKEITRGEIETRLRESVGSAYLPDSPPIHLHTSTQDSDNPSGSICFQWSRFFGGEGREFPPGDEWSMLVDQLKEARDWVKTYHNVRHVKLTGTRRLSASIAIGSVFSAVSGFYLSIEHRGKVWSSECHPMSGTPDYKFTFAVEPGSSSEVVVAVGVTRDIQQQVNAYRATTGLADKKAVFIFGRDAVTASDQANLAIRQIKDVLGREINGGTRVVHLFYAGPSFLAVLIGHRLNATATIQCYEWIRPGSYVATCILQMG